MVPLDYGFPKQAYEERVREAREDHLAALVARAHRQQEHRVLLRDTVSWLSALAARAGAGGLRRRPAR